MIAAPLTVANLAEHFDVRARIHGGGISGQAGALRHGIAKALVEADPNLRGDLKRAGFLARDAREVERKKAGLKKAPQAAAVLEAVAASSAVAPWRVSSSAPTASAVSRTPS